MTTMTTMTMTTHATGAAVVTNISPLVLLEARGATRRG